MPDEQIPADVAKKFDEILGQDSELKTESDSEQKPRQYVDAAYVSSEEEDEIDYEAEQQKETDEKLKEETQEEPSEIASEPAGKEDEYEDIPEHLIEAGRAHGFSDEKLIDLAENSPEVLEALAGTYKNYQELATKVRGAPQTEEVKSGQGLETTLPSQVGQLGKLEIPDLEDIDPEVGKLVKILVEDRNKMAGELNTFRTQMGTVAEQAKTMERQRASDYSKRIDGFFDKSGIGQFGESVTLTSEQIKARTETHNIAAVLQGGGDVTTGSLEKAVKAYKGLYGITDSKESPETTLSKKLQARKKKFTARPGGQKSALKFKTQKDKIFAAMDTAAKEGGYELSG